jgi:hypothetical protein
MHDALSRLWHEGREALVIFSDRTRNYYIQFAPSVDEQRMSLYSEAVSDEWLAPPYKLGDEGAGRLRSLGWHDARAGSNWSREFTVRDDSAFQSIALEIAETLRTVYGYKETGLELEEVGDKRPRLSFAEHDAKNARDRSAAQLWENQTGSGGPAAFSFSDSVSSTRRPATNRDILDAEWAYTNAVEHVSAGLQEVFAEISKAFETADEAGSLPAATFMSLATALRHRVDDVRRTLPAVPSPRTARVSEPLEAAFNEILEAASAYESIARAGTIEPDDGPGLSDSVACYQRGGVLLGRVGSALKDIQDDAAGEAGRVNSIGTAVYDVILTAVDDYGDQLDLLLLRLGFQASGGYQLAERVRHIAPETVAQGVSQEEAIKLKKAFASLGATARITRSTPEGDSRHRRTIPQSVRLEVWQRDGGQCVDCGSRELLEYDHVLPLSKGGSSTARNIVLRCQHHNRSKGGAI